MQPTVLVHRIDTSGQNNFQQDPFHRLLTEDEVNMLAYNGYNNYGTNEHSLSNVFNYKLQAEQTFVNYG